MTSAPKLAPGTRLVSTRCSTQVIVVRAPSSLVQITCGSEPMEVLGATEPRPLGAVPPGASSVEAGKHYRDPQSGLELLCTLAGAGPIAVDGRLVSLKHVTAL
jgi:hypothetical protein